MRFKHFSDFLINLCEYAQYNHNILIPPFDNDDPGIADWATQYQVFDVAKYKKLNPKEIRRRRVLDISTLDLLRVNFSWRAIVASFGPGALGVHVPDYVWQRLNGVLIEMGGPDPEYPAEFDIEYDEELPIRAYAGDLRMLYGVFAPELPIDGLDANYLSGARYQNSAPVYIRSLLAQGATLYRTYAALGAAQGGWVDDVVEATKSDPVEAEGDGA